ncbi:MAG: hypothetical protein Q9214_006635, partial [Letrouitia sp. 1 TL-2023]
MSATKSAHHPDENIPSLRASSWWPEKSNAWSLEDREDVYRRRTDGERWESICSDYPNRSKHAMQQQYSIMKKQNLFVSSGFAIGQLARCYADKSEITPAKGSVGRRKQLEPMQPAVLDVPSNEEPGQDGAQDFPVSISSKYDSDDTDYEGSRASLDSDHITQQSDKPRTRSTPKKVRGTQRATMNEQTPSESDDEPKEPVSERPRRAGAGHINYNLLANAADLNSEARSVKPFKKRREKGKPGSTLKAKRNHIKSDGIRLKKSRKHPSIDKSAKTPADMTTNGDQAKIASKSPKASKDVFEPDHGAGNSKPALPNAQELLVRSPKKRRRRIDAHLDGDPIEGQFDFQLGDPVKPKKRRHAQENVPQDLPLRQAVDLSPDIFKEGTERLDQRSQKPKKHSDDEMLATKEPKSKTKFGKRRGRPPVLARSASEAISRRPRGTQYQFPYLEGYVGPPPPDLATILARQDEMERQNGPRSPTPLTATTEGSFAAATEDSVEKGSPGLKWEGEIPAEPESGPLEYQKTSFPSEELDKAREEGRRMQAAQDSEKRAQRDYILKEAQQRIAYLEKQRREVEKEQHEVHKEHEKSLKALRQGNKAKIDGLRSRHLIEMESQRAKHIEEMKALRGQLPPPSPPPPTVTGTSIFHANPALEPPMHPPP